MRLFGSAVTAFLLIQAVIIITGIILVRKNKKTPLYYWLTAQIIYLFTALFLLICIIKGNTYQYQSILFFLLIVAAFFIMLAAEQQLEKLNRGFTLSFFITITISLIVLFLAEKKTYYQMLLTTAYSGAAFYLFATSLKYWNVDGFTNFKKLAYISSLGLTTIITLFPILNSIHATTFQATLIFIQLINAVALLFFIYETGTAKRYKKIFQSLFDASVPLYQSIFNKIGLPLVILEPDGTILSANQKTSGLLEERVSNLKNKNFLDYISEENKSDIEYTLLKIKPGNIAAPRNEFKCWLIKKNSKPLLVKISFILSAFSENQESYYIIVSLEDISHNMLENKRIREYAQSLEERLTLRNIELSDKNKELALKNHELIQINKSKNIFFANVSHELRTPLVAVCGYIEMLLENKLGPTTEKIQNAFTVANKNLNRLTQFINNLLDLARMEALQDKVNKQQINLKRVTDQIFFQIASQAIEKNIDLRNEIPEKLPPLIIDPRHIEQILINLISNAIKFTPSGHITLSASKTEPGRATINVTDTGPGIPDEDKAYIFDRFYQIERRSITKERGTGLGLAIVKEIVNTYDGKVSLKDNPKGGAIFSFDLPCLENVKERKKKIRKILTISNNRQQNSRIKQYLLPLGMQVHTATTGLRGLEMMNKQKFDLIFIDMLLPDLEAAEICKMTKESEKREKPTIYITTFSLGEEDSNALFLAGAKGIITKPFDNRAIARVINDELHS